MDAQRRIVNRIDRSPQSVDREWAAREGATSFAGYPLMVGGRVVGVIALLSRRPFSDAAARARVLVVRADEEQALARAAETAM